MTIVELNKSELITLIQATQPWFGDTLDLMVEKKLGILNSETDTWHWNDSNLKSLTEGELLITYQLCKQA